MTLRELIARYRVEANDKVEPYFSSDKDVTDWLNDAESEACIRGRLIHESTNPGMCVINIVAGQSVYKLHRALYELDNLRFQANGDNRVCPVYQTSQDNLNVINPEWRQQLGDPHYAIQGDASVRVSPVPARAGLLMIEGYRLPKAAMESMDDEPEINAVHHRHLVHWALHKAFSVPDSEFIDPNRSAIAESNFSQYFGERPDSDLRRITREDVPHHVRAFWP